ncbi:MAG: TadE/TadG family type IV pilus assembly protein [Sphingomonadaceae bacterium]
MRLPNTHRLLLRDTRGVAFVEFAMIAPVMLFLILGGLELANYAIAQFKVSQIAMTVADNAGRVTTGIDEANIYEVFAGANVIGGSMGFEQHGRVVLSSLQDNDQKGSKHGQMINWQRCWGDLSVAPAYGKQDKGRTDSSLVDGMGPTGDKITSIPGTAVMFVEVSYQYQPLMVGSLFNLNGIIRRETAFNVRGRQNNDISNTESLTQLTCK